MEASVEEKGVKDIEAATFVESTIIDHSRARKIKPEKLGDSTATAVSKKGMLSNLAYLRLRFI